MFEDKSQPDSAAKEAQEVSPTPPQDSRQQAIFLYAKSGTNHHKGNFSQSVLDLKEAISLDNTSNLLWTALATLYFEQGNLTLAEEAVSHALAVGRLNFETFFLKGAIHL